MTPRKKKPVRKGKPLVQICPGCNGVVAGVRHTTLAEALAAHATTCPQRGRLTNQTKKETP